jgi:hypothetical protein
MQFDSPFATATATQNGYKSNRLRPERGVLISYKKEGEALPLFGKRCASAAPPLRRDWMEKREKGMKEPAWAAGQAAPTIKSNDEKDE